MLITYVISWELHEGQENDDTWYDFIEYILRIFTEKSHSKLPAHTFKEEGMGEEEVGRIF